MVYHAVGQDDHDQHLDDDDRRHRLYSPTSSLASPLAPRVGATGRLFLDADDHDENTSLDRRHDGLSPEPPLPSRSSAALSYAVQSLTSGRRTKNTSSYEMVEGDDFAADDTPGSPYFLTTTKSTDSSRESFLPLHIPRPSHRHQTTTLSANFDSTPSPPAISVRPIARTASGRSTTLRHPTPDLQVLQGAYVGNIEHLEKSAERLSMTSSIEDAIREMHTEQKRADSRKSSLLSSQTMPTVKRQASNTSSIVDVNSAARSGGYSPAGFTMSPKGSASTGGGSGRSASKGSRFGSRPEPGLEGRPLDSLVDTSALGITPALSWTASVAEQIDTTTPTVTPAPAELVERFNTEHEMPESSKGRERAPTAASTETFEPDQKMFADFDGNHTAPRQREVSGTESNNSQPRRASLGNRLSTAMPQSYSDPSTGQKMVYYPAPVPMMLNLPQKLSKNPSSMARNKRRSQVMSNIPAAARKSAIWLPDVLETEDEPHLPEDDETQQLEYVPQHQRMSMGGRRLTQDLQHMPPQLRASTFFDLPAPSQVVELKEQSAVATLDSILDASALAPVGAFTDHAFAGHLGAEVYGRPQIRNSRAKSQLLESENNKRRSSTFNLLRGRRASHSDLQAAANENRRSTMSNVLRKPRPHMDSDDEDDYIPRLHRSEAGDLRARILGEEFPSDQEEEEDEGQLEDEIYHGPPTTLLAELQLRKQQQKHRTRPVASAYPNGLHSTLLELDAVAQVEQRTRKGKRINLAWEDPAVQEPESGMGDDEDVPLGILYNAKAQIYNRNRPMGLMERREAEDNEPLSRRRDRLQGRPPAMNRASTMMNLQTHAQEDEGETLAERIRRLKEQGGTATNLPSARPVSGDFASEMMSQFGGLDNDKSDPKGKGKGKEVAEEEETLGQRRKRLQAEREARAKEGGEGGEAQEDRPGLQQRRSLADILQAHPSAGASRNSSYGYTKPATGLLGLHDQQKMQRASTMLNLDSSRFSGQPIAGNFKTGTYNDGQGGIIPQARNFQQGYNQYGNTASFQPQFAQPTMNFNGFNNQMMMPFANTYGMGYPANPMNMGFMPNMQVNPMSMLQMGAGVQPLNQGQIDMVERWRQSVMQ